MKGKFIVITNFTTKIVTIMMVLVILIIITIFKIYEQKKDRISDVLILPKNEFISNNINTKEENYSGKSIERDMEAYKEMPEYFNGFKVIGKLEIPKIELSTYILEETTEESLNASVSRFYGPGINEVGNVCIVGHHYNKPTMFGKLKKVEMGDTIIITDIYGQYITYCVYSITKVNPDEVECLNQETNGEREITLITCTTSAIKRLVVKAVEVYD